MKFKYEKETFDVPEPALESSEDKKPEFPKGTPFFWMMLNWNGCGRGCQPAMKRFCSIFTTD